MESVQTFGRKKTAVAVAYCKKGRGLIKINGCPIELVEPEMLRYKVFEPILLLGRERFANVDKQLELEDKEKLDQSSYVIQHYSEKSHKPPFLTDHDYYFDKTDLAPIDEKELEAISDSE